jgi:hypothetical protein
MSVHVVDVQPPIRIDQPPVIIDTVQPVIPPNPPVPGNNFRWSKKNDKFEMSGFPIETFYACIYTYHSHI